MLKIKKRKKGFFLFCSFAKKIIPLIDLAFTNTEEPEKGKLLISDPFLDEDYFRRSVVYLCEHTAEGSFGFVINNFISINLSELDESFPNIETQISLGGPVEINSLYFVHNLGDQIENSVQVSQGIYIGGDFKQLSAYIKETPALINNVRFFIGYAGWKGNQLNDELSTNSWIVSELKTPLSLFESKSKQSWKKYMYDLGGKFRIMSKFPIDPNDN